LPAVPIAKEVEMTTTEEGRPVPPEPGELGYRRPEARTETATARFTPAELEAIQARAVLADGTVSVWLRHAALALLDEGAAPDEAATPPLPVSALPPPVADFGPVRLELMGHRYREGHLSEVVIAGTPFLRLDPEGGASEFYRPDAVYCITPGIVPPPVPRAEIPVRFGWRDTDEDELVWGGDDDDDA
jgi:hypothetical protein